MTPQEEQQRQSRKSRIPEFKNREEEAEWFDTHDMADYQDDFKTVEAQFASNLFEGLIIRFDKDTLGKLRAEAHRKGTNPATLARTWIMERLRSG